MQAHIELHEDRSCIGYRYTKPRKKWTARNPRKPRKNLKGSQMFKFGTAPAILLALRAPGASQKTLHQIGLEFDVTREYVRQVAKAHGILGRDREKVRTAAKHLGRMAIGYFRRCVQMWLRECGSAYCYGCHAVKLLREMSVSAKRGERCLNCWAAYKRARYPITKPRSYVSPERARIYGKVRWALRTGKLIKPNSCERCGNCTDKLHAHHADYSKPLSVEWLCAICHGAERRVVKPAVLVKPPGNRMAQRALEIYNVHKKEVEEIWQNAPSE